MGRPRKGESLGETGNVRLSGPVYKRVQEILGLRGVTAASLISPKIQDWLATEFSKAQKELGRIDSNPAMMPKTPTAEDRPEDSNTARGGTIRLPIWDVFRLEVIAAIRRQPTSLILHQKLYDWVVPELMRAMQEKQAELGVAEEPKKRK